jgi:peroxiredoxin
MVNRRAVVGAFLSVGVIVGITAFAQNPLQTKKNTRATLDEAVKDFKLRDLMKDLKENQKEEDAMVSLSQFKDKKTVVLFFLSEQCSVTRFYDKRIGELRKKIGEKNLVVLGVRCSANDTPDGLRKWVESKNFDIPLLNDAEGKMTSYFRVRQTPTFAVIDTKGTLRYKGSFDDDADEKSASKHFVADAVEAIKAKKMVAVKENPPFG